MFKSKRSVQLALEKTEVRVFRVSPTMPADVPKLCAVFHVVITSKRTENRFCMHCDSAILGIEQPAKSVGYSHTNTSFPLYIISLHRLECQRRTYSTRRRWLVNKSAVSKQPLQTTQIMNINNITRVYAKITGGGGIPPLAAHAYAVDTRRFFFPYCPAPLAPGYEASARTLQFPVPDGNASSIIKCIA